MPQSTRKEQKELTRQRILDAAYHLYSTMGFTVPTQKVAQKAGISHGAVFVHFPTREQLQLSVLERFSQELCGKFHRLSIDNFNIAELLRAHVEIIQKQEPLYKRLISEIAFLPYEMKLSLISIQSIMSYHFGLVVSRGQQAGTIKNVPLHMLFNTWIGLLNYYLQNSDLFAPEESVLSCCGTELIDSFVLLITKEKEGLTI